MMLRIFSVFVVATALSCANGQLNPFDMSGFFKNLGGDMQKMFQDMQSSFKQLVPWYNGPNVCVDEKYQPDPLNQQFLAEEFGGNSNSETCRGNNYKYACVASINENGVALQRVRIYECCPGFIRAAEGPGCVQNNAIGG